LKIIIMYLRCITKGFFHLNKKKRLYTPGTLYKKSSIKGVPVYDKGKDG
jgi:hypothetical protein